MAKISDLYREDMEPVMDLSKGAELLYELKGKLFPAQFVSFQGYYTVLPNLSLLSCIADESSNLTSKGNVIVTHYIILYVC